MEFPKALFSALYFSSYTPPFQQACSYFISFHSPLPLCRWCSTFLLLSSLNLTQASLTCRRLRNQMTPNILPLNSYKTEFLLIRHEETTYTIPHSTLWTLTHSQPHFRRLNFIIFIIFVNFAASDHILILKEQEPSPLFTPNLTTVIFFNWHTLHNLKYLNRLQQIQNSDTRSC